MTAIAAADAPVVLPASGTPCQRRLDEKRAWARTLAVRTGSIVLGVRADTDEGADLLEQVLAPLRAPAYDDMVAPNFSVEIGAEDRPRRLFLGYRAHQLVARRHSRDDLLGDVVTQLDDVPRAMSVAGLSLAVGALSTPDGGAVLLPLDAHRVLLSRRDQLSAAGLGLLPSQAYVYDAAHGTVETGFSDDGVRAACEALGRDTQVERLPVRAWCLPATGDHPFEMTGSTALVAAFGLVTNRGAIGTRAVLDALREAVLRHLMLGLPTLSAGGQARAVLDVIGQ